MAKTRIYRHYCPVARSLEVIGEKWSLLIVRDLLGGPQRFSDLLRYLGGITPKWLTLRLRDLESAGIIERDSEAGRREVWYRLTPKGRELAPVIEALSVWGIEHAMPPPRPGEPVHPGQPTAGVVAMLNQRSVRLPDPVTWVVRFTTDRTYIIGFDGELWSVRRADGAPADGAHGDGGHSDSPTAKGGGSGSTQADVLVETTPEAWVAFLMASPQERRHQAEAMRITGAPTRVEEFVSTFGYKRA